MVLCDKYQHKQFKKGLGYNRKHIDPETFCKECECCIQTDNKDNPLRKHYLCDIMEPFGFLAVGPSHSCKKFCKKQ